jgi:hypothetical protein
MASVSALSSRPGAARPDALRLIIFFAEILFKNPAINL